MQSLYQGWRNSGKNGGTIVLDEQINKRVMACLIEAWKHIHHSPPITVGIQPSSWLHSGDKIRPFIRTVCCRGWTTSTFSSWGKSHFVRTSSFFSRCLALLLVLFLRLSPPSHRTALCSSSGRGACAATSVLCRSQLFSCGVARWQGDKVIRFLLENFRRPVSLQDVYMRAFM